jgi:hypothetical protein
LNYAEIIIDNTKDALNKNSNKVESIHRSRYKSLKINLDKKWELISDIINNHNGFIQIASELDWELKVKINLPIVYEQENIID